jgi:hypothetical protein
MNPREEGLAAALEGLTDEYIIDIMVELINSGYEL